MVNKTKETTLKIDKEKVEKGLLKSRFPQECEQIPLEALEPEEKEVVQKCINHEEFNDEEFKLLKKTLQKYRPAIEKYKPSETIEAVEKTRKSIQTEQEWLDIVNNEQDRKLLVNVPFNNKIYPMEFEIQPLDDSRVVETLQAHVDLFKDYNASEVQLFSKAQQGEPITPEEAQIVAKMQQDIESKASVDRIKTMNTFLANQLLLPDSTADLDKRMEFWAKFPFMVKSAIMIKVENRLGLSEQSNTELFPDS